VSHFSINYNKSSQITLYLELFVKRVFYYKVVKKKKNTSMGDTLMGAVDSCQYKQLVTCQ